MRSLPNRFCDLYVTADLEPEQSLEFAVIRVLSSSPSRGANRYRPRHTDRSNRVSMPFVVTSGAIAGCAPDLRSIDKVVTLA